MTGLLSNIGTVQRALDYHARRHNLLASNVANVDTPGFRALELLRIQDEPLPSDLPLDRTRSDHLPKPDALARDGTRVLEDATAPVGADGNAVSLDREMAKLSANDIRYETAAAIVQRKFAMLRYICNDGQGG